MNKTGLQIALLLLIGTVMGWYAYSYYQKASAYNEMTQELNTYLYLMEQNERHIVSTVERSVIFLHFNNDLIANAIKTAKKGTQQFLREFETRYGFYGQSYKQIRRYRQRLDDLERQVYLFVRTNAAIKNSMTYLQTRMASLDAFGQSYSEDMTDMVIHLLALQANFKEQSPPDRKLLDTLRSYSFDKAELARQHSLFIAHIELLYDQLVQYPVKYRKLLDFQTRKILKDSFADFKKQNDAIQQTLQEEFETIIFAAGGLLVAVLVYILLIHNSRLRIQKLQKEQKRALSTDSLTGLYNRAAMKDRIKHHKSVTVVVVNILEFRNINNLLGPSGGDYALVQLGALVRRYFGTESFRIGSDEFAAVVDSRESADLDARVQAFVASVEKHTFVYHEVHFPVNVLVGISDEYPYVINAKSAIETIKNDFTKKIAYYTQKMNNKEKTAENIRMLQEVKTALEEDRIRPFFHAIVDLHSTDKKPVKYEALVRMIDRHDKPVSPFFFLDIAKRSKLYTPLTKRVIEKSFAFVRKYGHDVSINLSSEDITDEGTIGFIYKILEENSDIAQQITFELVESEEVNSYESVLEFVNRIKSLGASLAIDDFGSGYSNFEYLLKFQPDILKIDGSLIKDIAQDRDMETIVRTMHRFAKDAGIKTVAEFVDNETVDAIITKMGLDYGQGFYYAKPADFNP